MSKLVVKSIEYNEYVIGFIINFEDGRFINVQYEKCTSNHPEPAFTASIRCEGDETWRAFDDEELEEINKIVDENKEMAEFGRLYTEVYYSELREELGNFIAENGQLWPIDLLEFKERIAA